MTWNRITFFSTFLFCIITAISNYGIFALVLEKIHVPSSVMIGESLWLNCTFDLQGEELYSIKWYKNGLEFYRFLPKADPPEPQKFPIEGIFLDMSKSSLGNVFLNTTDLNSGGEYKCEVSGEAPHFKTVRETQPLKVYSNGSSNGFQGTWQKSSSLLAATIILITFKLF